MSTAYLISRRKAVAVVNALSARVTEGVPINNTLSHSLTLDIAERSVRPLGGLISNRDPAEGRLLHLRAATPVAKRSNLPLGEGGGPRARVTELVSVNDEVF